MTTHLKLVLIKTLHTVIWLFFNVVIFYFLYAVIFGNIGFLAWVCLGLIALEGLVLLLFKSVCPVTILARKYSDSQKHNFDIFLPNWLAKHNKLIYTAIVALGVMILIYRLAVKS